MAAVLVVVAMEEQMPLLEVRGVAAHLINRAAQEIHQIPHHRKVILVAQEAAAQRQAAVELVL
jgi:hypothetical protein